MIWVRLPSPRIARRALGAALVACTLATPAVPQERFWLFWEQAAGQMAARRFPAGDAITLRTVFDTLTAQAQQEGRPADDPEAPQLCSRPATASVAAVPSAALEQLPISAKPDALRGLTTVGMDLSRIKMPPEVDEQFPGGLDRAIGTRLQSAGILVVPRDLAAQLPGQPQLTISFSATDPNGLCMYTFTVSASLTQTAVLTRDTSVKITASVWSFSKKGSEANTEGDALLEAAAAFITAWQEANATAPKP